MQNDLYEVKARLGARPRLRAARRPRRGLVMPTRVICESQSVI